MNEELAAYITRLCELSGHTTRIDDDLRLIPNEGGWRGWRVGLGVGVEVFT